MRLFNFPKDFREKYKTKKLECINFFVYSL